MNISIEIIKVSKPETLPGKNGTYQKLEITYKDLTNGGKVNGKKLVDFGDYAHIFKAALNWKEDDVIQIQQEKLPGSDGKSYWTWVNVVSGDTQEKETVTKDSPKKEGATKQQWVPDDVRQRLIVRQSALERAITFEAGNSPSIEDVLRTAERFVDWVFEVADKQGVEKPTKRKTSKTEPVAEVE